MRIKKLFGDVIKSSQKKLSEKQKEIVESPEKLIFVSSGPGTGKTRVIVERVKYLVENREIRPEEILILTFTKSASEEIKSRLSNNFEPRTFDSYCWEESCETPEVASDDWTVAWFHVYYGDKKSYDYSIKKRASVFLNEWFEIKDFLDNKSFGSYCFDDANWTLNYHQLEKLVSSYEADLRKAGYMTHPQIRRKVIENLSTNGNISKYKAIIVDEIQDINSHDLKIIELISESKNVKNIFLIGDLNQSIYSFRGSDPKKLCDWIEEKRFKKFYLNQNYRSTKSIVNVCNAVIEVDKSLEIFTDNEEGEKVLFKGFEHSDSEAKWVVNCIKKHLDDGISLSEIAILTWSINDKFSDLGDLLCLLKQEKIDYNFNDKEKHGYGEEIDIIKKYWSLICHCNDTDKCLEILRELLNFRLFRSNREKFNEFQKFIREEKLDFMTALRKFASSNHFFVNIWELLRNVQGLKKLSEVVQLIYEKNIKWYYCLGKKKLLHHHLLVLSFIEELEHLCDLGYGLDSFDEVCSEIISSEKLENKNSLTISTIHKAKGLEWKVVFVVQHGQKINLNPNPQDNERATFVALSRAKKFLYVTCPKRGKKFEFKPYEFLDKKKLEKIAVFEDWE